MSRNHGAEAEADKQFAALQDRIFSSFGAAEPSEPVLRCRNATQTSVVLEWDPIDLATADLISLSLYRNGQKAGNIPRPLQMHSTKISGLAVDTEYTFHLVLRTTAGTSTSQQVSVRTHKMTDLSGVTITTGILPSGAREELARAVDRVGAKMVDGVRIDTTHFVTTEGRGIAWEKAVEMNIPVVRPEWVEACERNGRILGVTKFYLDAVRPPGPVDDDLRRGSTTSNAAGAAAAPVQPPAHPVPTDKELPARPTENGNGNGNGNENGNGNGNAGMVGDGRSRSGSEAASSNDDDEKGGEADRNGGPRSPPAAVDEGKTKSPLDGGEQKVRLEDKDATAQNQNQNQDEDQGFRLRPVEPIIRDPDEDEDKARAKRNSASPGDGASFQDVAL